MKKTRQQLILEIIENITSMKRTMAASHHEVCPTDQRLSRAQSELLFIVAKNEGLSVKEIAQIMHVTGSAVTQLVDSLVKMNFLTREIDENDRRSCCVCLSEQGSKCYKNFKSHFIEKFSTLVAPLDDNELVAFRDLFRKIIDNN